MFKTGPDGFGGLIFIDIAFFRPRNRPTRLKSGPWMFEIGFFEHPRPRNGPHHTVLKSFCGQNDGTSCGNHLELLLRPKQA